MLNLEDIHLVGRITPFDGAAAATVLEASSFYLS